MNFIMIGLLLRDALDRFRVRLNMCLVNKNNNNNNKVNNTRRRSPSNNEEHGGLA